MSFADPMMRLQESLPAGTQTVTFIDDHYVHREKRQAAIDILDRDFCIVLCRHDGETYFAEMVTKDSTEVQVADDLADGQYEHAIAVLSFNPALGVCRDISEDIARTILTKEIEDNGKPGEHIIDFLEQHLGCRAVASPSGA